MSMRQWRHLTEVSVVVLNMLREYGPMRTAEIAAILEEKYQVQTSRFQLERIMSLLKTRNLVTKEWKKDDRRVMLVFWKIMKQ